MTTKELILVTAVYHNTLSPQWQSKPFKYLLICQVELHYIEDSGLCCCVPCLWSAIYSLHLLIFIQLRRIHCAGVEMQYSFFVFVFCNTSYSEEELTMESDGERVTAMCQINVSECVMNFFFFYHGLVLNKKLTVLN